MSVFLPVHSLSIHYRSMKKSLYILPGLGNCDSAGLAEFYRARSWRRDSRSAHHRALTMLTPSTPSSNATFSVRVPLPATGSAEYRARASGPALVMASVEDGSPASLHATRALRVLHAEFDKESTRFARFDLPLPGEYLLEVTRLFRDFDVANPRSYCVHPEDLRTPVFLGTLYVPGDVTAARKAARSLWVATATTPSFVVTRIQTCNGNRPARTEVANGNASRSRKWMVRESTPSVPASQSPLLAYSWLDEFGQYARRKPPDVPGLCLVGGSHAGHHPLHEP